MKRAFPKEDSSEKVWTKAYGGGWLHEKRYNEKPNRTDGARAKIDLQTKMYFQIPPRKSPGKLPSTCKTKATNFPNSRQKYFFPNLRRKGEHFGIETNWSFPNSIIEADFFPIWNKNVYNKSQQDSFRTIARFVTGTNLAKLQQMETEAIFAPRASHTCL